MSAHRVKTAAMMQIAASEDNKQPTRTEAYTEFAVPSDPKKSIFIFIYTKLALRPQRIFIIFVYIISKPEMGRYIENIVDISPISIYRYRFRIGTSDIGSFYISISYRRQVKYR